MFKYTYVYISIFVDVYFLIKVLCCLLSFFSFYFEVQRGEGPPLPLPVTHLFRLALVYELKSLWDLMPC